MVVSGAVRKDVIASPMVIKGGRADSQRNNETDKFEEIEHKDNEQ